jgi:hypothetical protein
MAWNDLKAGYAKPAIEVRPLRPMHRTIKIATTTLPPTTMYSFGTLVFSCVE